MAGLLSFLSDISVQGGGQPSGPLGKLSSTDYGSNTYRYPADLGSSDKNHYMMIQILQQRKSQFITGNRSAVGVEVGPKFGADAGQAVITQTANKLVSEGVNKVSDAVSSARQCFDHLVPRREVRFAPDRGWRRRASRRLSGPGFLVYAASAEHLHPSPKLRPGILADGVQSFDPSGRRLS